MHKPNPAYGLTDEFRQRVVETAGLLGVRAAAAAHNVSITSVYNWIKWYSTN